MPRISTVRNLIVGANAAPTFALDVSPEGVVLVIENEGTRHLALMPIEEAGSLGVALIRLAERASLMAESKKVQGVTGGLVGANGAPAQ